ncbi:hypothetical protein ABZV68_29625 [Streptomyces clavifer]|uniref:hypothetical protein n=1 Tax=Streptomyces clavifer TaxID=68188 RepID=UPI0033B600D1
MSQHTEEATVPGRPAGVDYGDAAYWARIRRIVDEAPPFSEHQKAVIRAAFAQPAKQAEKAA